MATTASHTLTNQAPISTHLTRWILGLTIMACITPCNTWTGNPSADPSSVATAIVIASYNICCNWKELSSLIEKAKEKPWDIVLIQEVGLLEDHNVNTINKAADEAGYSTFWNLKWADELKQKQPCWLESQQHYTTSPSSSSS
jgi:hypothetical protein